MIKCPTEIRSLIAAHVVDMLAHLRQVMTWREVTETDCLVFLESPASAEFAAHVTGALMTACGHEEEVTESRFDWRRRAVAEARKKFKAPRGARLTETIK